MKGLILCWLAFSDSEALHIATQGFRDVIPAEGNKDNSCDIGQGTPEMGSVSLSELKSLKFPPFGLGVERDLYFKPDKSLLEYWEEAREAGRIVA